MERFFNVNYEFDQAEIFRCIDETVVSGGKGYVCGVDGNVLSYVQQNEEYRNVINHALFNISDSSWVPIYLRWIYGKSVKAYPGPQLFIDIIKQHKYRMYFLGSKPEILEGLREQLCHVNEDVHDMVFKALPFCEIDDFDCAEIGNSINADAPDIIWVSLGAPKQEQFMYRLEPYLQRGVMIAVGAAFKFYSGVPGQQRAPKWIQHLHLEFVYRLFQEPKKQSVRVKNYLMTLPRIFREEMRRKRSNQSTN